MYLHSPISSISDCFQTKAAFQQHSRQTTFVFQVLKLQRLNLNRFRSRNYVQFWLHCYILLRYYAIVIVVLFYFKYVYFFHVCL